MQPLATESTLQRLRLSASLRLELPARASYGREGTARAGDPLALLPLHEGGSLILLTSAGRLARLSVEDCEATGAISPTGGALLSLAGRTRLVAAFMLRGAGQLVVAREDGALRWWESDEIPLATVEEGRTLCALTTQRLQAVDVWAERIKLRCGERLLGFVNG